jgi:hypothetical protein
MKRFVVLCSVVALISLYVPVSWATAPAISDLPDVRLEAGSGSGTGLGSQALDAYNVESFIRDFDDAVRALTITLPGGDITMVDPPPSQAPNSDGSLPTIELDVSNNVDVFGRSAPGWARYTVNVDDASNPVTSRTAIAKYSTFAFNTPSLSEGRFFDLTASGWQLAYAWMGQDVTVPDLDSTITPPTAVDWEVYMNRLQYPDDYLSTRTVISSGSSLITWLMGLPSALVDGTSRSARPEASSCRLAAPSAPAPS